MNQQAGTLQVLHSVTEAAICDRVHVQVGSTRAWSSDRVHGLTMQSKFLSGSEGTETSLIADSPPIFARKTSNPRYLQLRLAVVQDSIHGSWFHLTSLK